LLVTPSLKKKVCVTNKKLYIRRLHSLLYYVTVYK